MPRDLASSGKKKIQEAKHTRWNNDHDEQHDDADDKAHAHLHVLPPHLFSHPVGASPEPLGGGRQVVGLVLERVKMFATFGNLEDVRAHRVDSLLDFLAAERKVSMVAKATWLDIQRSGSIAVYNDTQDNHNIYDRQ